MAIKTCLNSLISGTRPLAEVSKTSLYMGSVPTVLRAGGVRAGEGGDEGHRAKLYTAFFSMMSYWSQPWPSQGGPYWFEDYELQPVNLFGVDPLTQGQRWNFTDGQRVALSEEGAAHMNRLLVQTQAVTDREDNVSVLRSFVGVVRHSAREKQLLMYLRYPWGLQHGPLVGEQIPVRKETVHARLRDCGRLGLAPSAEVSVLQGPSKVSSTKPGDGLLSRLRAEVVPEGEPPFTGLVKHFFVFHLFLFRYVVDWLPLSSPSHGPVQDHGPEPATPTATALAPYLALRPEHLISKLGKRNLPTSGDVNELAERLRHAVQQHRAVPQGPVPTTQTGPFKARVELPTAIMGWPELKTNLMGENNAYFDYIEKQYPGVVLALQGSASAALVGEARLHVSVTAAASVTLDQWTRARRSLLDLTEAVVEHGAVSLNKPDQKEKMKAEISFVEISLKAKQAVSGAVSVAQQVVAGSAFNQLFSALQNVRGQKGPKGPLY